MSPRRAITAGHERWQQPGTEEQWSDSFYFGGGDGRGLAFYSRIGRRPNEGVTEGALGIWLPGQGFLLSFARDAASATTAIAAGPLSFDCLAAAGHCGSSASTARAACSSARSTSPPTATPTERSPVAATLRFTAWGDPLSFGSGLADGRRHRPLRAARLGRRHAGRSTGGATRSPGAGMRDHSWGVRDWQRVPYWRWFGMVADPDNFLVLNNVGLARRRRDGGRLPDARRRDRADRVVRDRVRAGPRARLPARRSRARARDALGRETTLAGRALEVAPLRQRRDGRLTHVNEALTEYDWEGRRGTGISEYLIQTAAASADGLPRRGS